MTYFSFLLRFIEFPLVILLILAFIDARRPRRASGFREGRAVWLAIALHVILAVLYTTPWDNYLVATGVWYYNPELISGILLGWVPLEEYTFFVLETILTGLWWWFLSRRIKTPGSFVSGKNLRIFSTLVLGLLWLVSAVVLISGWKPGVYLCLILAWALPAIMLQLAFGADILWHHRKLVLLAVLPVFLYIAATDSIAIASGTWTIDPAQSTGIMIGTLPIEEAVFFLVIVILISFGLTLSLALESQVRWSARVNQWLEKRAGRSNSMPAR